MCEFHKARPHTRKLTKCYNVKEDESKEEDDPRKLNITKLEGLREVQGHELSDIALDYSNPKKMTQINIGMPRNPKLAIIGDYWDKEIVAQIVDLLRQC